MQGTTCGDNGVISLCTFSFNLIITSSQVMFLVAYQWFVSLSCIILLHYITLHYSYIRFTTKFYGMKGAGEGSGVVKAGADPDLLR